MKLNNGIDMKTVKIGIMPREDIQKRILDIVAGRYKPKPSEPKIWFSSLKSVSQILSTENMELLKIINKRKPKSFKELAQYTGRHESNLSRTLKKLESSGVIEVDRTKKETRPIAKSTQFDIRYGEA